MSIPPLEITARTTLGAMLVLSSAYFQSGSAELIAAEGEKLQKIFAGVSSGSLSVYSLTTANNLTFSILDSLLKTENEILLKIAAGIQIHNDPAW